jgi:hypothetical protein
MVQRGQKLESLSSNLRNRLADLSLDAFIGLLSQHDNDVQHIPPSVPHKVRGDPVAGCGAA